MKKVKCYLLFLIVLLITSCISLQDERMQRNMSNCPNDTLCGLSAKLIENNTKFKIDYRVWDKIINNRSYDELERIFGRINIKELYNKNFDFSEDTKGGEPFLKEFLITVYSINTPKGNGKLAKCGVLYGLAWQNPLYERRYYYFQLK